MIWLLAAVNAMVGFAFFLIAVVPLDQAHSQSMGFGLKTSVTTDRLDFWQRGHVAAAPFMYLATFLMMANAIATPHAVARWGLEAATDIIFYTTFGLSIVLLHIGAVIANLPGLKVAMIEDDVRRAEQRRKKERAEAALAEKQRYVEASSPQPEDINGSSVPSVA